MKRELVLVGCALACLAAGVALFIAGERGESRQRAERVAQAQHRTRESMMGFFRVVEDVEAGEFQVFFPPGRLIASFQAPVQLEVAGLQGLAMGAFFAQQPAGPGGTPPPRCQLFKMSDELSFHRFSWLGRCRVDRNPFSDVFWLDYAPFGTRERISLPLEPASDGARVEVSWREESVRA